MKHLILCLLMVLLVLPAACEEQSEAQAVDYLDLSASVINFQFSTDTPVFVRNREVTNPDMVYLNDDLLVPVQDLKRLLHDDELHRIFVAERGIALDGKPVVYQALKPGYVPLFRLLDALDFEINYDSAMALVDAVPPSAGQGAAQPAAQTDSGGSAGGGRGRLRDRVDKVKSGGDGGGRQREENWQKQTERQYQTQEAVDKAIDAYVQNPPIIVAPGR